MKVRKQTGRLSFPATVAEHARTLGVSQRLVKITRRAISLRRQGVETWEELQGVMGESNCPEWLATERLEDIEAALGVRWSDAKHSYVWREGGQEIRTETLQRHFNISWAAAGMRELKSALGVEDPWASSKEDRARAGLPVGQLPYGYGWGEERLVTVGGERRWERIPAPKEGEAEVVQDIFDMYLEDEMSPKEIAEELNTRGVPGPRGRRWNNETVRDIINNPFYAGYIRYRGTIVDEDGRRVQPRYTGTLYPGLHEALISLETWDAAQRERYERAVARRGERRVKRPKYTIFGHTLEPNDVYFVEGKQWWES